MKYLGTVTTYFPNESLRFFKDSIEVVPFAAFTQEEAMQMDMALIALEKQITKEELYPIPKTTMLITENGKVNFEINDGALGACTSKYVIYAVDRWRKEKIAPLGILIIFLEELCHSVWNTFDETKVKHKVVEVLRNVPELRSITIEEIYDMKTV